MTDKYGFNLDDFSESIIVTLVETEKQNLMDHQSWKDYHLAETQDNWTVISSKGVYEPDYLMDLGPSLSEDLRVKVIRFYYHDTSDFMGYAFFDCGEKIEAYDCGPDDDEMEEAEFPQDKNPGEIILSDGDEQFIFFSESREPSEDELQQGMDFIDDFFQSQKVLLSWDHVNLS